MFLRCLSVVLPFGAALLLSIAASAASAAGSLRICADPDNLPFSNDRVEGFDNRIAVLVAHELGREPVFVWARSRRGFLRERFNRNDCDLLTGVPEGLRGVATTAAYYQSSYMFVTPRRTGLRLTSFDDPALNGRRIGLQILEEDLSPPSLPLIRNGHAGQLVGFESFGSRSGDVVHAVADGRVGVAVVWGPIAGYYANRQHLPLTITPVSPVRDSSGIPFTYAMAFAVHQRDLVLRDEINAALKHLQPRIQRILAAYHVPLAADSTGAM
jgi:mxaJ protein